jgi:hypothetical protein
LLQPKWLFTCYATSETQKCLIKENNIDLIDIQKVDEYNKVIWQLGAGIDDKSLTFPLNQSKEKSETTNSINLKNIKISSIKLTEM